MVPCGIAGHRHCIVSVSSRTIHLRVLTLFISLNHFIEFCRFLYYNFIYLFINFIIIFFVYE